MSSIGLQTVSICPGLQSKSASFTVIEIALRPATFCEDVTCQVK